MNLNFGFVKDVFFNIGIWNVYSIENFLTILDLNHVLLLKYMIEDIFLHKTVFFLGLRGVDEHIFVELCIIRHDFWLRVVITEAIYNLIMLFYVKLYLPFVAILILGIL